jgi:hypothetical protein
VRREPTLAELIRGAGGGSPPVRLVSATGRQQPGLSKDQSDAIAITCQSRRPPQADATGSHQVCGRRRNIFGLRPLARTVCSSCRTPLRARPIYGTYLQPVIGPSSRTAEANRPGMPEIATVRGGATALVGRIVSPTYRSIAPILIRLRLPRTQVLATGRWHFLAFGMRGVKCHPGCDLSREISSIRPAGSTGDGKSRSLLQPHQPALR